MIKQIIVSFLLFSGIYAIAQDATASPYSFYGIGDIKFKGTVENRSMGGLSIFRDSIHLNLQNPASLSGLKLTTFTAGATTDETTLSNYNTDNKTKRTSLDYLALGLPLGKFGVTFGLMPYSAVGYKVSNVFTNTINTGDVISKGYSGTGGINKFFVGAGYQITPEISVGATIESNFGKIQTNGLTYYNSIQYANSELNTSNASGISFTTGLMYQSKFKSKTQIFAGFTIAPQSNLNFTNQRIISRIQYLTSDNTNDFTTPSVADTTIKLPSKLSIGIGFGEIRKWQIGTEIVYQNSSNFGNRFNDISNVIYENATQLRFGGFYIPKYNSFTSYFQRVTYRGGFNFQNTGLIINGKSIKDQAFIVGVGLPLGGFFANLNLGFEIGKRGTILSGLIVENYKNLSIGLSINDKWFVKRRYD